MYFIYVNVRFDIDINKNKNKKRIPHIKQYISVMKYHNIFCVNLVSVFISFLRQYVRTALTKFVYQLSKTNAFLF